MDAKAGRKYLKLIKEIRDSLDNLASSVSLIERKFEGGTLDLAKIPETYKELRDLGISKYGVWGFPGFRDLPNQGFLIDQLEDRYQSDIA